jgi:hypothetical protein
VSRGGHDRAGRPPDEDLMWMIYVDGDACPVKSEIYKVVSRYAMRVTVVAT